PTGSMGGGIYNHDGTLMIMDSTFSANGAIYGAGIANAPGAIASAINTTISGNVAGASRSSGGGIRSDGTMTLSNCTISGNGASAGGGGVAGTVNARNTIIAKNLGGGNGASGGPDLLGTLSSQ